MKNNELAEEIYYIGVNDTTIDLFEGQYKVPNGISYNSYVIMDEKIAVMDSVDKCCFTEWLTNLKEILGEREPDYLVVQHMEPDHSGSVARFLECYPKAKIVCSKRAAAMLEQFFPEGAYQNCQMVAEGEELILGRHVLTFLMAPMVHWPEVMVTYDKTEKVLFSADAFGKFGALKKDVFDTSGWLNEARRYYINIVGKYGLQVQALLRKAETADIDLICPLHGPVLRENLPYYLEKYQIWSSYQPEKEGVVIAYASVYGNTKTAALELAQLLKEQGVEEVILYDLARDDIPAAVSAAFCYDRLIVACPTYDGGLFPCVESFLARLRSKNYQKRTVGLIENGTWAPMAGKLMKEQFEAMRDVKVAESVVCIYSALNEQSNEALQQLAVYMARV